MLISVVLLNKRIELIYRTVEESAVQVEQVRAARQIPAVPILIESGFNVPEDVRGGRFLMAFATSTVTATVTSTSTSVLIAICSSTSAFRTCG